MEGQLGEASRESGELPHRVDPREELVLEHAHLIRYVVSRIAARLPAHADVDDLYSSGVIGLIDAVERFDPDKGCKFKTYAEFRIRGAILDELRALDWMPRTARQNGRRVERAYTEVEHRLGRTASCCEVAEWLGMEADELQRVADQANGISIVHLDDAQQDGGPEPCCYGDLIEDERAPNPLSSLSSLELQQALAAGISELPEKERLVVSLYYYEDLNLKDIGGILGITESRVCQIRSKAVKQLSKQIPSVYEH
jgi:RNA polymerase sigma factor for flagellar operon FliA